MKSGRPYSISIVYRGAAEAPGLSNILKMFTTAYYPEASFNKRILWTNSGREWPSWSLQASSVATVSLKSISWFIFLMLLLKLIFRLQSSNAGWFRNWIFEQHKNCLTLKLIRTEFKLWLKLLTYRSRSYPLGEKIKIPWELWLLLSFTKISSDSYPMKVENSTSDWARVSIGRTYLTFDVIIGIDKKKKPTLYSYSFI